MASQKLPNSFGVICSKTKSSWSSYQQVLQAKSTTLYQHCLIQGSTSSCACNMIWKTSHVDKASASATQLVMRIRAPWKLRRRAAVKVWDEFARVGKPHRPSSSTAADSRFQTLVPGEGVMNTQMVATTCQTIIYNYIDAGLSVASEHGLCCWVMLFFGVWVCVSFAEQFLKCHSLPNFPTVRWKRHFLPIEHCTHLESSLHSALLPEKLAVGQNSMHALLPGSLPKSSEYPILSEG